MSQYLFVLGRETELCFAELETVLSVVDPAATIQNLPSGVALVQRVPSVAPQSEVGRVPSVVRKDEAGPSGARDVAWFIHRLGGTRLIAKVLGSVATVTAETLTPFLPSTIREVGFSSPTVPAFDRMKLLLHLKKLRPGLRYRPSDAAHLASGLSERILRRKDGLELLVLSSPTPGVGFLVAEVVAVQDTRAWTERDRGLPALDPRVGMLPPKLARIMVNLAEPARSAVLSKRSASSGLDGRDKPAPSTSHSTLRDEPSGSDSKSSGQQACRLLDPFCGSGQIPIEALRVGWDVTASDLDAKGVERTRRNLTWAQERSTAAAEHTWTVFQSDIVALTDQIASGSIDAMVTEPDLGPPLTTRSAVPSAAALDSVAATISRAFDAGRTLIRPSGRLVIVIPVIAGQRIADRLDDSVHAGYTLRARLHYARPDSRVERELFVLDKQ